MCIGNFAAQQSLRSIASVENDQLDFVQNTPHKALSVTVFLALDPGKWEAFP